jgi:hypothetical protein
MFVCNVNTVNREVQYNALLELSLTLILTVKLYVLKGVIYKECLSVSSRLNWVLLEGEPHSLVGEGEGGGDPFQMSEQKLWCSIYSTVYDLFTHMQVKCVNDVIYILNCNWKLEVHF